MTQPELPAALSQPDFLQGVRQFKADLAQAYEVWRRQLDSLSFEEALQQLRLMSAGCTTPRPLEQWHDLDANYLIMEAVATLQLLPLSGYAAPQQEEAVARALEQMVTAIARRFPGTVAQQKVLAVALILESPELSAEVYALLLRHCQSLLIPYGYQLSGRLLSLEAAGL